MPAFITQQVVRFGDVDPAGIAFYPRIFDFVHQAMEALWDQHVGRRYYHLITEDRIGFPLAHSEVDFKQPLRFGDTPIVRVTCFRLGGASLGLRYVYTVQERVCLDARMVTVCVNMDSLKSLPIPDRYRTRFEAIREDLGAPHS